MFLSHLLINAKAAAGVANEAIGVVGQINAVAVALADVLLATFPGDVGVDIEVGEEREHYEHVAGKQVLPQSISQSV